MDRETTPGYVVILVAKDNGKNKQLESRTKLLITLEDINDNAPVVGQPKSGKIHENMPEQMEVMTVQATDRDIGKNAELRYTLENYRDLFVLNENSGVLKAKKSLDREEQETYYLDVVVYDKGIGINIVYDKGIGINIIHDNKIAISRTKEAPHLKS